MALESRNFRILFDQFEIKPKASGDIIKDISCQLMQIENRSYINVHLILLRNVDKVNARAYLDFWKSQTTNKIRLYNLNVDACLFLGTGHKNRLFSMFTKTFEQHLNAKFICPFKANFNYTLTKWYIDEEEFPTYVPEGKFKGLIDIIGENQTSLRVKYHGRVIPNKMLS
ncbi:uncharacterized protein Dwil_GK19055 [Drosophila willistoni]|uniref:Uncharacterized protein n=1 Tax=Drosophila willistoni TaxID=7260 RepID=B4MUF5_DROWI|nr:uncharacterized protein LOC6641825 [Drosophila willistoni]EDW76081.2 uncharacterized protein Dwil_GK19055 [Drosophila willistoni]